MKEHEVIDTDPAVEFFILFCCQWGCCFACGLLLRTPLADAWPSMKHRTGLHRTRSAAGCSTSNGSISRHLLPDARYSTHLSILRIITTDKCMAKYFERSNLGSAGHNLELQVELPEHGQPSTSTMSAAHGRQACLPIRVIHIMVSALHISFHGTYLHLFVCFCYMYSKCTAKISA